MYQCQSIYVKVEGWRDEVRTKWCRRLAFINKIKQKQKQQQKLPLGSKQEQGKGLARQGWTGQDRAGQGRIHPGWNDAELAQDCKHKEIIKGANEEGNEGRQVGQINQ